MVRTFSQSSTELSDLVYDAEIHWQQDFQSAQRAYREYVTLVRSAYQSNHHVLGELRINEVAPTDQQRWLDHARFFYTKIPAYSAQLDQQFGLKPEIWAQALIEVHALISAKNQKRRTIS
ncbi:hypothetical protein [Tunicatimonas pelagia]|uniref:hypothetical protein n=1 Tax=Tunicatimonas pelagia TaxID=931531 RepID=UPI0026663F2B|nr:hypothetical protein [Tunicatimonas pelagia]WKN40980.1 hypothetical protein P0M28_18260 [Tunicatimonas pelagia]